MDRLSREVPGAVVAGLLYEHRPPKTLSQRIQLWRKNISQPGYLGYVFGRASAKVRSILRAFARTLLRFSQATNVQYSNANALSLEELTETCRTRDWKFHLTTDIHGPESLEFVKSLQVDIGIVLGTRILKPLLYKIPRDGSINIHKRKVPDYRGGGPIGLWELLDGQKEIGCTVHRVEEKVDTGAILRAATIPIDEFDGLDSLGLKADVVGEDLLVETIRDFVNSTLHETPQSGEGKTLKGPKAWEVPRYERRLAAVRPPWNMPRGRPAWKLAIRSSMYFWLLPFRNWKRRWSQSFPVSILYHHLITDRPHPMGIPTSAFVEQLRYLKRHYRIVSLHDGIDLLRTGKVAEPIVVLTFDDGYAENFVNLRAALRAEPTPVTLFVCPKLIEEGQSFPHDVRDQRLDFRPLTVSELKRLAADGMEIASHTRTHFDCGSTDMAALESEIAGSREDLERILGSAIPHFSFPWGQEKNMSDAAKEIASSNYDFYFSAYGGANFPVQGAPKHLKRWSHPHNLWELELTLQGIQDFVS